MSDTLRDPSPYHDDLRLAHVLADSVEEITMSRFGAADLQVESISGSNDGLTTPADIALTKDLLPPDTEFTVIQGGVHAFFGDYGDQPGDGTPTISREEAQAQIQRATIELLASLTPKPKTR